MVRTIQSGAVTEKTKFWVPANVKPRSGRKKGGTTARKQDVNERDGKKRLAREINCNIKKGDFILTLTYDTDGLMDLARSVEDPRSEDQVWMEADKRAMLALRKINRELAKQGIKPKTFVFTADRTESGKPARIHHHILITGEGIRVTADKRIMVGERELESCWPYGSLDWQGIWDRKDQTPLAEYLWNQTRRLPGKKKYHPSRNLEKPILIKEEIQETARELQAPKGAKLLHRAEYEPGKPQYIRYIDKKHQTKRETTPEDWDSLLAMMERGE